jgi:hypothetical protein
MRDIRPGKPIKKSVSPEKLDNLMNNEMELYETSSRVKRDVPAKITSKPTVRAPVNKGEVKNTVGNLKGSKVPVTNIHVDKSPIKPKKNWGKIGGRPLFVKVPRKNKRGISVQVGEKERNSVVIFLGLLVIAGIVAGIIFLPTATITLKLRTAPLLVDEQLIIGSKETSSDNPMIPGTAFFREVQIDGNSQVKSTEVIGTKATGVVQIVNKTLDVQKIKDKSRLVTADEKLFYMQKHAIIPPNSRVSVAVEAAEAGEEGNIEAQKLNFAGLDKDSQSLVFAEVKESITGGTGDIIAVVKEEDIEKAKISAGEDARTQAESEIKGELLDGWEILNESWTAKLDSFESSVKVGDKEPVINYQARVVVRVMGYEKNALEEKMKEVLESGLDDDYMLFPGAISYVKSVKDIDWETAEATVAVRVTHTTIPMLSIDTLRSKLAGRSVDEAKSYLEGLPGVRSASMNLWPFWVKSIPRIEKRVSLSFESENQP